MPVDEATLPAATPDRLSVDPRSPHHIAAVFERDIGIRLNDRERFDVSERIGRVVFDQIAATQLSPLP